MGILSKMLKSATPLAARQVPRVYNHFRQSGGSQRVIEGQNWIIIIFTGVIIYLNYVRVVLGRQQVYLAAERVRLAENNKAQTNEILCQLSKINEKIK